ncbi:MAG TPA: ATP-binding protein [Acidimicrobiales bacterium]|nr:ATP-binding protein [Acidimicrobiales bacterium]
MTTATVRHPLRHVRRNATASAALSGRLRVHGPNISRMAPWWARPVAVTAAGLALTAIVGLDSGIGFAYKAPELRASLETAVALVGMLVAFLVFGRFRRSRRLDDLAIATALVLLALDYPVFVALASSLPGRGKDVGDWLYLISHAGSASLLCWAALFNDGEPAAATSTEHPDGERSGLRAAASWVICTAVVCFLVLAFFGFDPDAHHPSVVAAGLFNQPGVSAVRLLSSALFLGAAMGFSRRSRSTSHALIGWLGIGCALLAVGDFAYGLFPPMVHSALHFGDVFRLAAVLVFAVGAVAEIRAYWRDVHRLARADARRVVAVDLHDGIAQELAFLSSRVSLDPSGGIDPAWVAQVRAAADRALAESRRAISALAADQPLAVNADIEQSVRDLASVAGTRLELELPPTSLAWLDRELLIRIVREAVVNAIRHGRASVVRVACRDEPHPVLEISDDGVGFEPGCVDPTRQFGLTSMRDRAHALGGVLDVSSAPGRGTRVEVSWPPGAWRRNGATRRGTPGGGSRPAFLGVRAPSG